ncbi:hypothetical protein BX661DRAFT_185513 [Kickxella alabastrina]|uniref:uncharacterized protein n=1 Tax=Kickxella alabastrina TaxID=61397 RepID=UPI00221F7920|nr:uncharacterized protein BX661DRAFT_185513 [Kickxella alabastrina]KAI7824547.1 hypothetical protein BX661DRAFT_185513 [Kickxella alabastrina]
MSASNQARIAYRRLLKIERRRFSGDLPVMMAALLKHAAGVEEVIRGYVVQAPRNEEKDNTYNIKFTSEHALRDGHPIIIKSSLQKDKETKTKE